MNWMNEVLGLQAEPKDLTFLQISLRGTIVFVVTLIWLRLANKRFLAKLTAMDAILGFILASMLARAVNGSASFWPTLAAGLVIVGLHRLLAFVTCKSDRIGKWIKGEPCLVVRDGEIDMKALQSNELSRKDLEEELRLNGNLEDVSKVRQAMLERNGQVSVIKSE